MKSINSVIMVLMVMALSACGGSGGGGGGGNPGTPNGSATMEFIGAGASDPVCVKSNKPFTNYNIPQDEDSCGTANGTWIFNSGTTYSEEYCRINGVDFSLIGGGSADPTYKTACETAGGTFIASVLIDDSHCSGYTNLTCSEAGGTLVPLDQTVGDIQQSTVNIVAGNNTITLGPVSLSGIDSVTSAPVYFEVKAKVTYMGNDFWQATIGRTTGGAFSNLYDGSSSPSFTVSLPVSSGPNILYFAPVLYTDR